MIRNQDLVKNERLVAVTCRIGSFVRCLTGQYHRRGLVMKAICVSIAILAAAAGVGQARTLTPNDTIMGLWLTSKTPGVSISNGHTRFYYSSDPAHIGARVHVWFPSGVNVRRWRGVVDMSWTAPKSFSVTGVLNAWSPNGGYQITFTSDRTWSCSGDCNLYRFLPNRTIRTKHSLVSGTYKLAPVPVPAGALLGVSGLLALFAAGFQRRRRSTGTAR